MPSQTLPIRHPLRLSRFHKAASFNRPLPNREIPMAATHEETQAMETDESTPESQRTDPRHISDDRARLTRQLIVQDNGYTLYRAARQDQHETPTRLYQHGVDPDALSLAYPTLIPNRLKLFWFGPPRYRRSRTPTSATGKNDCLSYSPRQTIAR